MKNAGNILTILGGFFGILASAITGIFGGISLAIWNWFLTTGGAAYAVIDQPTAETMAQNGFLFSAACMVIGFIAFFIRWPWIGAVIIVVALVGMDKGGDLIALSLTLAVLGGALVLFDGLKKKSVLSTEHLKMSRQKRLV